MGEKDGDCMPLPTCPQRHCDPRVPCSKYGSKTRISPKIDPLPASRTHSFHRGHLEKDWRLTCFPGVLLSLLNKDSSAKSMRKKQVLLIQKSILEKVPYYPFGPRGFLILSIFFLKFKIRHQTEPVDA